MNRQSKLLRSLRFAGTLLAVAGLASLAQAADKAKAKAKDAVEDDAAAQPQDLGTLAAQDDGDDDKPPPKAKTKKSTTKKSKKQPNANKLKREKEAAALANQNAQAAGNAGNQMPQQMQPGMMPQGGLQSRRGNNAYNNQGMFMLMRQFDANGNGQLDPNELQNMKLAIAQMRAAGPNWTTMQYLQRFDTNGNGQLDPNEMQAAQAALTQGVQGAQIPSGGTQLPNPQFLPKSR